MAKIDIGIILFMVVTLDLWVLSMIVNMANTLRLCIKGEDWRIPAYKLCGQVLMTMACLIGGFLVITR